ncbi:MAG: hypothetical protein ACT4P1_08265 [Sporichthyaceae bacterium]
MSPRVVDLLDTPTCEPGVCWTTGNVAEALPGVLTTFSFSFLHGPLDLAMRIMFHRLGVFTAAEVRTPRRVEDQFWTTFSGRAAANIDQFRRIAGMLPGTSASGVEQQLFGYVRPQTVDENTLRRYPAIAVKAPRTVAGLPARHDEMFAQLRRWRLRIRPRYWPGSPTIARSPPMTHVHRATAAWLRPIFGSRRPTNWPRRCRGSMAPRSGR